MCLSQDTPFMFRIIHLFPNGPRKHCGDSVMHEVGLETATSYREANFALSTVLGGSESACDQCGTGLCVMFRDLVLADIKIKCCHLKERTKKVQESWGMIIKRRETQTFRSKAAHLRPLPFLFHTFLSRDDREELQKVHGKWH